MNAARDRLTRFLFPVESDRWLSVFRSGLGVQVILYAFSFRNDWNYLFATTGNGLTTRDLSEALLSLQSRFIPRLGWIIECGAHVGMREEVLLSIAWLGLLLAGCGLLVGFFCRSSAILAWFLHLCAAQSGDFVAYGVDNFMTIGLFYLMLSPLPDRCALDWRLRKSQPQDRHLLGFFRRVLQLHLCVIYFFGGLTKCLGSGWWNGTNVWRALTRPPFDIIAPEILVRWKYVLPMAGILVCLIETGYPLFIWRKRTRTLWLVCVLTMHAAIGLTMGMYLFSLIMIILNLSAFAPGFRFSWRAGAGIGRVAWQRPASTAPSP